MKLEFPIKHIEDNLVFGHDGRVWAFFNVDGFSYDFLDDAEKMIPFDNQNNFFTDVGLDQHLLVVPNPTNINNILDNTINEMETKEYELKESGIFFIEQVREVLNESKETNESIEYKHYIGIQLDPRKNKHVTGNVGLNIINSFRSFLQGFTSPVYRATGLMPNDILVNEIEQFKRQSKVVHTQLERAFSSVVRKATTTEMILITENSFSTRNNNSDVEERKGFSSGVKVTGKDENGKIHEAIRYNKRDFHDLQNTNIDDTIDPKSLLLSRITDDHEVEELYTSFLTIEKMEDVYGHPGSEWIYDLQLSMPFPVTISIRIDNQPNDLIRKKLSNIKLEYEDQNQSASEGGRYVDSAIDSSERNVVKMEEYFQSTGLPAYSCSFVFKVTATTRDELKSRVNILKERLRSYEITAIEPYGEQLPLMMEMIPSSQSYLTDYHVEVAPNFIAGLMFGATTNIGDNRGFYIGQTTQFTKPVFIQPDLAAKSFEGLGNVVNSISVMVAGMTGKGKSFFMNLFIYLSALTGSRGIIIDPKGDRVGWGENGLPYIDKDLIEVWTLGSSDDDAGSLDPFRTSPNLKDGRDITMDILSYVARINIEDPAYDILSQVVEDVSMTKDPCLGAILSHLKEMYKNRPERMSDGRYESLENLIGSIETMRRNELAKLLFGEVGQKFKILDHKKPIQVLMIQNLDLPGDEVRELRPSHRISEAIMISITAWTKQYMLENDRRIHKFILQDEASAIERNPMGAELMDFIVRQGRYYNTTLLKGSQNATDYDEDVANIGMKFSFALRETREAKEMLDYLNLPKTDENINMLKSLDTGVAMFQDIYGRTATVKINPIFNELFDAFDSSTSTAEERKREEKRMIG